MVGFGVVSPVAAQLQWDPGQTGPSTGPSGGDGTWTTTAVASWFDPGAAANVSWSNGATATFSGAAGTVTIDNTGAGGAVQAAGLTFSTTGYTITGSPLTLTGGGVIDTTSVNATIGSGITGNVGLTKNGTGTLTLSGPGTFTGLTAVNAGVLAITNAAALGGTAEATVVIGGAALQVSGGITAIAEPLILNGTGVANDGALRNTAGNNSWSGAISLSTATRINADAGTLTISGGISGTDQNLTIGGAGNTTINTAGISTGAGTLTKDGSGTLTLAVGSIYTGATAINAGVVSVTNATGLGTTAGNTTVAGGAALQVSGGITIAEPLVLNGTGISNAGALRKTASNNTTLSGAVTIASNTRINADAGTLTMSGAVGVGANTLTVGGAGNTTISGQITLSTGGTFIHDSASTVSITNGANGGATGTFLGSIQVTNGGTISYNTQTALGTTGAAGTILLDNGTLLNTATGNAGTYITTNRNIVLGPGGGTLRWDDTGLTSGSPNIIIIQNTAPGTTIQGNQGGALNKTGGGIIAIAQPATYDGPTNILAGALRVRTNNNIFPTGTALSVSAGAVFDLNQVSQQVGSLTGAGDVNLSGGAFTVGNSNSTVFTGRITEGLYVGNGGVNGTLTKVGTGSLTVGSTNYYSGGTTIVGGVLSVGTLTDGGVSGFNITAATAGSNSITVSSAAGLTTGMTMVNRNLTFGSTITGISGTTITLSAPATTTVTTAIAAAAGFPGGIGMAPNAASNLVLSGGTLLFTGPAASSSRLFTVTSAGGTLDASGSGPLTLSNTGANVASDKANTAFTLTSGSTTVGIGTALPSTLSGLAIGMPVSGTGIAAGATVTSIGVNTFTLSAPATAGGSQTLTFTSLDRTLTLTGSNTGANTVAGVLADSPTTKLGVTKTGPGTWVLTGTNTYTGPTLVSGGTLQIGAAPGGPGALSAVSTLTVNSGGTVAGFGTINRPSTVASDGIIAPGASAGTLSFLNGLTVNGTYGWELATAGSSADPITNPGGSTPGGPQTNHDALLVAGPLDFTGSTLNITSLGTTGFDNTQPYSWQIATASGAITGLPTLGTISGADFGNLNGGAFTVATSGGMVLLNFTPTPVPEPASILLVCGAAAGLGWWKRRRTATA
jgi:autotransporter-associated beta strand protein